MGVGGVLVGMCSGYSSAIKYTGIYPGKKVYEFLFVNSRIIGESLQLNNLRDSWVPEPIRCLYIV